MTMNNPLCFVVSERMDPDYSEIFAQASLETNRSEDIEGFLGEKRKMIQPQSLNDPKLEELKTFLIDWINGSLHQEHIVVKSLEEDLFDGLILHHLLARLGDVKLDVEEIALTAAAQKRKLRVVMDALKEKLRLPDEALQKWSVERE
ncbi:PARVG protein, partial [Polyodon spathula]|nr:PARVG protein [Polyodon spathula]